MNRRSDPYPNRIDLSGKRFGRLTVLHFLEYRISQKGVKSAYWKCKCDCGNLKSVLAGNLSGKKVSSCGCYHKEISTVHEFSKGGKTHPFYWVWRGMINRCNDPKREYFHRYGGRGITVCQRWMTFKNFVDDMFSEWKQGLTIERKDNNGPYSPENCRWATRAEQSNNKGNNIFVEFKGDRKTIWQWAKEVGINGHTIRYRLNHGWSTENALTIPPTKFGPPLYGNIQLSF